MHTERVHCTYTKKWTGAADRVRVHLTHGLVVEQGHPEETHTQKHMVLLLRQCFTDLHRFLDPPADYYTQCRTAEPNLCRNPDPKLNLEKNETREQIIPVIELPSFVNRGFSKCLDFFLFFYNTLCTVYMVLLQVEVQEHINTQICRCMNI